jgi:hypothetical protein
MVKDMTDADRILLKNAEKFLIDLESLRSEIAAREELYKKIQNSKDRNSKELYHTISEDISLKCLYFARDLIEMPTPGWIDRIPREYSAVAEQFFSVVCEQMCASLKVFDLVVLHNAKVLVDLAIEEIY